MSLWEDNELQAGLVKLDLDVADAEMLELQTRAILADARADSAWDRFLKSVER